jgi:phosphoglycerate dehydrogenase-like enzyme
MPPLKLIVLTRAGDPYLPLLDAIRDRAVITFGATVDELADAVAEADAMLAWVSERGAAEAIFAQAKKLRWLHLRWAGLDNFLFPALIESPVVLTNSRGVYSQSLGEFVIACALFFAKDMRRLLRAQAERKWEPFVMQELRGATMGIVGYGDIGKACASRAQALGMRVLAMRRNPDKSKGECGPDGLIDMTRRCDYVVASAPLTPETRGMIGVREIAAMKPTAVLMNVGRGPVIDEAALIPALREHRIRGAALDVFTHEPLPPEHPFFTFDNVLLSPHCADNTPTWNEEAMHFFLQNFDRFAKGDPLLNIVDKHAGY